MGAQDSHLLAELEKVPFKILHTVVKKNPCSNLVIFCHFKYSRKLSISERGKH